MKAHSATLFHKSLEPDKCERYIDTGNIVTLFERERLTTKGVLGSGGAQSVSGETDTECA